MKKVYTLLMLAFSTIAFSQHLQQLPATINAPTSSAEKCYAGILNQQMLQTNSMYAQKAQEFENYMLTHQSTISPKAAAQYVIPVVFHIINLGEPIGTGSNVSEEIVKHALRMCNERYRNMNGGGGVDTQIEFALAVRDPNGNCTNGITRTNYSTNSQYANYGVKLDGNQGISDSQLKGIISWNRQKYYNIYIVTEIDNNNGGNGTQGYAYFASAHGQSMDGAVFMAANLSQDFDQTMVHELGHALNLYHTFEGDNNGTMCPPSGANQGDMCGDTPPHVRSASDCNVSGTNACDGGSSNALFVHNYMDYSSSACATQFTNNQKSRMIASLTTTRSSFFTNNLALVPSSAPTAGISIPQSIVCSGSIQLLDNSLCVANTLTTESAFTGITYGWSITNGSVTLTSTKQNPSFTLSSPGWYSVTMSVTHAQGSDQIVQQNAFYYSGTNVAGCTPNFTNQGNYANNVYKVQFNTINSTTDVYYTGEYEDFICSKNTVVDAGSTYPLNVTINAYGSTNYLKVYVDWDNSGTFIESEKVLDGNVAAASGNTPNTGVKTANIIIPSTAVKNQLLRMRVICESSNPTASKANCSGLIYLGDVEDYGILIKDDCPTATLSVQPSNISVCQGQNGTMTTTSSGATSYQWQVSTNGGSTWSNISNGSTYSGVTTPTLSINNVSTALNTNKYRVVLTNSCGDVNSNAGTLTVPAAAQFTTQPTNKSVCVNGSTSFSAAASVTGYQWQVKIGTTWNNLTNNSIYSGVQTATLTINNAQNTLNNNQYRCVVQDVCTGNQVPSNAGTLTVKALPNVTFGTIASPCVYDAAFAIGTASPAGGTFSGTGISGQNTFNPSVAGVGSHTITYTVTQNGCTSSATQTIVVDGCLGMDDLAENQLLVFPNPTNSVVRIEGNTEGIHDVYLIDNQGRLIGNWKLNENHQLDLSAFSTGHYYLRFIGTNGVMNQKIELIK